MFGKIILAVFTLTFSISSAQIYAQNSKSPKQIKILNNYGAIPFEDGKTIITEIKFTGLDSEYEQYDEAIGKMITESDFRDFLRLERATINSDDKFYGYKISKAVKIFKESLSNYGYLKADVIALGEQLPKNRMRLVFDVKRGLPARVLEIRFDGNINISNEEYFNNIKECSGDGWKIFGKDKYKYYTQKCSRDLMFSKGYFEGDILSVLPKIETGNYVVTVNVKEGVRYRIGEIKFEGIKVFTEKELLEMLDVKSGDIADALKIREFLNEKLKRFYEDKGYILFDSEFDPEFIQPQAEGLDAIVNFNITIDEGSQFKISKIEFVGIPERKISDDEDAELKNNFPLKEIDIFNRTKLEEGIKKLNESKKFYPIDADKDVQIRKRERSPKTELIIGSKESRLIIKPNTNDWNIITSEDSPEIELIIRVIKIEE
ncbi:hypothetical protein BH20ACI4_BH20ACI4_10990 [soil metagenome]